MNNNLKDTLWTTIWILCVCIFIWVTMVTINLSAFNCEQHVGCGEHEMIQPEGHGR